MNNLRVNIACGDIYIDEWQNFDFANNSSDVKKANLLSVLPLKDDCAELVYSSHFIEHIPYHSIGSFLNECYRITKPGGYIRLVLPDFEEICETYLSLRKLGGTGHEKADFLMLEMLDQCVRKQQGGRLGEYLSSLAKNSEQKKEMVEFVKKRTGHIVAGKPQKNLKKNDDILHLSSKIKRKILKLYIAFIIALLPSTFRQQNVSLTDIGENHAWMYDFYSLERLLIQAGFQEVSKMTASTSNIKDFPFTSLDTYEDGHARKGSQSMYIEAYKK